MLWCPIPSKTWWRLYTSVPSTAPTPLSPALSGLQRSYRAISWFQLVSGCVPWSIAEDDEHAANSSMTSVALGEPKVLMGRDRPEKSCKKSSSATSGRVIQSTAKEASWASCCSEPNGHRQLEDSSDRGGRASKTTELRIGPPAL
jgi:hypothetical protein